MIWRRWVFYEAGWPMTVVWGWRAEGLSMEVAEAGYFMVPSLRDAVESFGSSASTSGTQPVTAYARIEMPWMPYWFGLLVNSGVYGAAWWVLLVGRAVVRRAVRRGRGRCGACGYDLRGLTGPRVCPECGAEAGG